MGRKKIRRKNESNMDHIRPKNTVGDNNNNVIKNVEVIQEQRNDVLCQDLTKEEYLEEDIEGIISSITEKVLRLKNKLHDCEKTLSYNARYINDVSLGSLKLSMDEKKRFLINKKKIGTLTEIINVLEDQKDTIKYLI
uniref:BAG domain-containing protein n=1 Tax=Parastrongyloides trichosuri TaxID=131310 RepID=A0A0N5A7G3_PARTI